MRKSSFVKYASFLMMLVSLVRFFFGLMMFNFFSTTLTFGAVTKEQVRLASIAMLLIVLGCLADLIAGFVGMLNWEEPLKAKDCARWGAAALLLGLAGNILQGITGYGISLVAWITGAVIPGLFLCAAVHFAVKAR